MLKRVFIPLLVNIKYIFMPGSTFLVVTDNGVVGKYADIETAKRVLKGVSTRNRFGAEVHSGNVLKIDRRTVGGQMQSSGKDAGFNKWWGGWSDINRLMNMAQAYLNSPNGITILTYALFQY